MLLRALPRQPQRPVRVQLPDHTVAGGEDGRAQHHAQGDQLHGDFLELAEALGDGVA